MFCIHGVPFADSCIACQAEGEGNSRTPGPPYDIPGVMINQAAATAYKQLRDAHAAFPSPLWIYGLALIVVSMGKNMGFELATIQGAVEALWNDPKPPEVVH